jgi:epoxyqueuosine reductase
MPEPLSTAILKEQALKLGFSSVGVCAATATPLAAERLQAFLAAGRHGDMIWLETRAEERAAPKALWPAVESVVMLGLSYAPAHDPLKALEYPDIGAISVYAQGSDYHDVVKKKLKALAGWLVTYAGGDVKVFVDTAPVMEKPLAQAAGLGWTGKHTNLVSCSHGSWLFLGALYTTLVFKTDDAHQDRCGRCTACQDICPTKAFPKPYELDARRCLAYLTIEHKGPIAEEFRTLMGNRIYGCDDCLAVCPWNKFAKTSQEIALQARAELQAPELAMLAKLDDAAFRKLFAKSPIKRIGRNRFVRNVLYAMGNSARAAYRPIVEKLCQDEDAVVRDAAQWALRQITQPASGV